MLAFRARSLYAKSKTTMSDISGDGSHMYIWELHLGPGKEAGRELVMSSRSSTLQSMGHQYSTFPTIWQYVAASRIARELLS